MDKSEIIEIVNGLNLPKGKYWLVTGSAMVVHGLKPLTHDIDMGGDNQLIDGLVAKGYVAEIQEDGKRKIVLSPLIEIYEDWIFDKIEEVDGVPVLSLQGLLQMKQKLNREKDKKDILRIEERLKSLKVPL